MDPSDLEKVNHRLQAKYREIEKSEIRFEEFVLEDAEIAVIAFGTAGRISRTAITTARSEGIKVGLHRPISLYPFPLERIRQIADEVEAILVVEMNGGQMVDDVRRAVEGKAPISFYGRMGGVVPLPDEVLTEILKIRDEIGG
jgi:2-oxoglutarate ferredoxin oxidoreductase subunit alpha